jgi:hypothetical protein
MKAGRDVKPVIFPETASEGYFVHARYREEQLRSPEAGRFYVELETAIALAMAWINDRHPLDPKTLHVSGVRGANREILALAFDFRGVPSCGALVARTGFDAPHREKQLGESGRDWKRWLSALWV